MAAKKFLAVEGRDEVNFFTKWLEVLGINDVAITEVVGKRQFKTKLPALLKTDLVEESILAIVRDADGDATGAFDSLVGTLTDTKNDLPFPLSIPEAQRRFTNGKPTLGIFIIENELEDLCLNALAFPEVLPCVDSFFNCLPEERLGEIKKPNKAKVNAYLSAMPKDTDTVGIGAQKGYWNFNAPALDDLRTFLEALR
jgi:hypothetical protein